MLVPHPMEDHKKMLSTQILIKVEVEVLKFHFEVDTEACMVDIISLKVNLMEVDEGTSKEEEVIKVNNQITTQIATTARNLGTSQIIVMHHMTNSMIGGVSNNNV